MKVKFPLQKKEEINGEIINNKKYIDFEIDVGLTSQMRYEAQFPDLAKNEDLLEYSRRINQYELTQGKIISMLKVVFCWFKTDISFMDFLEGIDVLDKEFMNEFIISVKNTFDLILKASSEKN